MEREVILTSISVSAVRLTGDGTPQNLRRGEPT